VASLSAGSLSSQPEGGNKNKMAFYHIILSYLGNLQSLSGYLLQVKSLSFLYQGKRILREQYFGEISVVPPSLKPFGLYY
jgi:hypothetical protein